MADILGFPYGARPGDYVPSDVEPPCEGDGNSGIIEVSDPVRRPAHYIQGNVEAIDIIEHVVSGYRDDPIEAGLIWQILKYVIRAPHKGDKTTDLRKAQFYLNRAVSRL